MKPTPPRRLTPSYSTLGLAGFPPHKASLLPAKRGGYSRPHLKATSSTLAAAPDFRLYRQPIPHPPLSAPPPEREGLRTNLSGKRPLCSKAAWPLAQHRSGQVEAGQAESRGYQFAAKPANTPRRDFYQRPRPLRQAPLAPGPRFVLRPSRQTLPPPRRKGSAPKSRNAHCR